MSPKYLTSLRATSTFWQNLPSWKICSCTLTAGAGLGLKCVMWVCAKSICICSSSTPFYLPALQSLSHLISEALHRGLGEERGGLEGRLPGASQTQACCFTGTALTHLSAPLLRNRPYQTWHHCLQDLNIFSLGAFLVEEQALTSICRGIYLHYYIFRLCLSTSRGPNSRSDILASKSVLFGETRSCQNVLFWWTKVSPNSAIFTHQIILKLAK